MPGKREPRGPPEGVLFPPGPKADRSTTAANKGTLAAAVSDVDASLAERIQKERNWRFKYDKYFLEHVELSAKNDKNALVIAKAGLNYLHNSFEFTRDGKTTSLASAMKSNTSSSFHTGFIKGKKPADKNLRLEVPYKNTRLSGDDLVYQVDKWAAAGTIEPSAAAAIKAVIANPNWLDLSDKSFVLLGAGSAMGPFLTLLSLGANIIAIDLDRPQIWKRLIEATENSSGTITFPLNMPQDQLGSKEDLYAAAGCNLFTQTPEIRNWITQLYPERSLIIGSYAYLDGEAHVRVSLAMDAIVQGVTEKRPNTALAYLCTPTDAHVIPKEAWEESKKRFEATTPFNLLMSVIRLLSGGKYVTKNARKPVTTDDGTQMHIVDAFVVPQGPNYALAKRLQHWRAMTARSAGHLVSTNVAPSTATASVVHNRQFAWAYGGFRFFEPLEVFMQETSNAVMCALLINDLRNPQSVASPTNKLKNPLQLFTQGSFHGGVWRMAYRMSSIGEVAALLYFVSAFGPTFVAIIIVSLLALVNFYKH